MSYENGYDWKRLEKPIAPDIWKTGWWAYGLAREKPTLDALFTGDGEECSECGEWWAPCNADGSPRPWPEAKPQTPALAWRRGKIAHELWQSGHWQYGLQGTEPLDGYVRYHGPEAWNPTITDERDWWAPITEDGTPRPWPDAPAAEVAPAELEWRRGTIPGELWPSGWWRCGGMGDGPQYGQRRLYGPEETAVFPRESEWWAPVNEDGTPREWPAESCAPAEPQPAPQPGTGDVIAQVIALLEKRKRLGIDDVVTVVHMLRGVAPAGVEPSTGIQPPRPREADNIASYEELDARVVKLEALLEQSVMDCSGLLERNKNLELLLADAREDLANAESEAEELTDTCASLREELRAAKQKAAAVAKQYIAVCPECAAKPPWRCKPTCGTHALDGAGHEQCRNAVRKESRRLASELREAERTVEVEQSRYHKARRDWDNENAKAWEAYDEAAAAAVELADAIDSGRKPNDRALEIARKLRR